jgi:predicted DNA-binding transcriptional regulator YafY
MPTYTDNLMRLVEMLQSSAKGWTLTEICEELRISERTARRLLNDIEYYFVKSEVVGFEGRAKRWWLPPGATNRLMGFSPEELAELRRATGRLRQEGVSDAADALDKLRRKLELLTAQRAKDAHRERFEALMQLEADVMRPGPRPKLPPGLLEKLREALVERRVVTLRYRSRFTPDDRTLELEPHGILFGTRHYLVAFAPGDTATSPRLYAMTNMDDVVVTPRKFQRRAGFDLQAFAERSFGIFQEEPFEVVWRFVPNRAADVLQHHFHPTERKRVLDDGSVEVTFKAGGELEMCWHLFTWGADVDVVAPERLRRKYAAELRAALSRLADTENFPNPATP